MRQHFRKYSWEQWVVLVSVFLFVLLSSWFAFQVDESPFEPLLAWPLGVFMLVGFLLAFVVNLPFIFLLHFLNAQGEVISYEWYFQVLPFLAALIYTGVLFAAMSVLSERRIDASRTRWRVATGIMGAFVVAAVVGCLFTYTQYVVPLMTPSATGQTFDTGISVPGTRLHFFFPSEGFYGHGATIHEEAQGADGVALLSVSPTAPYNAERGAEFVTLHFRSQDLPEADAALEGVIAGLDKATLSGQYAHENGRYVTYHGQQYYVFRTTEDVTVWTALTVIDRQLLTVILAYKPTDFPASQEAHRNNDALFMDIMSRLWVL